MSGSDDLETDPPVQLTRQPSDTESLLTATMPVAADLSAEELEVVQEQARPRLHVHARLHSRNSDGHRWPT